MYFMTPSILSKMLEITCLAKSSLYFHNSAFFEFNDDAIVNPSEISWKLLHDVHEKDKKLDANLRKAPKLTNKVLHPGKYKQNVQLAMDIFHETTVAAINSYFKFREFQIQKISIVLVIIFVEQLFKMTTNLDFFMFCALE